MKNKKSYNKIYKLRILALVNADIYGIKMGFKMTKKTMMTTIHLRPDDKELLQKIGDFDHRSNSNVVAHAINLYATQLGLKNDRERINQ